jgi:hypothetical protein
MEERGVGLEVDPYDKAYKGKEQWKVHPDMKLM